MKNKWSILYLLLNLSEDPRKQAGKVGERAAGSWGKARPWVIGRKIVGDEQRPTRAWQPCCFFSDGSFQKLCFQITVLMQQCAAQVQRNWDHPSAWSLQFLSWEHLSLSYIPQASCCEALTGWLLCCGVWYSRTCCTHLTSKKLRRVHGGFVPSSLLRSSDWLINLFVFYVEV